MLAINKKNLDETKAAGAAKNDESGIALGDLVQPNLAATEEIKDSLLLSTVSVDR